jgi:uncharacterized phage-associated protein
MNIQDACDYIIVKVKEADATLSLLKLQKLLYYVQAWYLAFNSATLFDGKFQAWVHGPVNRQIYDRFAATKSLYSEVSRSDVRETFDSDRIPVELRNHIDTVLDVYAKYTGAQLEAMTHEERPWVEARKGFSASARCENEISEASMKDYYSARLG